MSPKTSNLTISALLFVCFILYAIIELRPAQSNRADDSSAELKRLELENDLLTQSNIELDNKYEVLHHKADSLQRIVLEISKKIIQLKKTQHEKVNAIEQLNNDELFNFFAGYKTDSTVDR